MTDKVKTHDDPDFARRVRADASKLTYLGPEAAFDAVIDETHAHPSVVFLRLAAADLWLGWNG